jgi:sterol desaturase/sphingolipid hydroxylase (fatty acid hydroxylase superfamily)
MALQFMYFFMSILGGMLIVEVSGYFWHRWAEHNGIFGRWIQHNHIRHHEHDYPTTKLRPKNQTYKSAKSWSWYLLTAFLVISVFLLVPAPYSFVVVASGLVYVKFVINYLHSRFHVRNHWLASRKYFQTIRRLHDIHHYGPYNYGILFFFMDRLFGTYRVVAPSKKQANFILERPIKLAK